MNEQNRKQIIMLAVIGVVLVGVLLRQFVLNKPAAPPAPSQSKPAVTAGAAGQTAPAPPSQLKTVDVDIDALLAELKPVTFNYMKEKVDRNVMTPLVGVLGGPIAPGPGSPGPLMMRDVTGIIWDEYDPVAVIDDEVVQVGHVYPDGTQVYAIEPNRVIFRVGDMLIPVNLKEL